MADNIWKKYETEDDNTIPPIVKQGVEGFSKPLVKDDNPWAKYEREAVPEHKTRKKDIKPVGDFPSWVQPFLTKKEDNPKAPAWVKSIFGEPEDSPNPLTVVKQIGKGIPVAGQFIPKDEEMARMDKGYPIASALAKGTGAIGSTMGPAGLVSKGLANAGHPGIIAEMMGQFGLGGAIAGADKAAEKGLNLKSDELLNSILWGGTTQATGPLLGKIVSPMKNPHKMSIDDLAKMPEEQLEKMFRPDEIKKEIAQAAKNFMNHPLTTGLMGGAMAFGTGAAHPLVGAGIGAAVPKYLSNTMAHNPTTQAILNALAGYAGRETQPQ